MTLTVKDIQLPPRIQNIVNKAYGTSCSLEIFINSDIPDIIRKTKQLSLKDAELLREIAAAEYYPYSSNKKSVLELIELENESLCQFSLGCPLLDKTLDGGIRLGQITEIYGENSSGKTQLCLQMALNIQKTFNNIGKEAKVVYINTEYRSDITLKRLKQLTWHFVTSITPLNSANVKLVYQKYLNNIYLDCIRERNFFYFTLIDRLPKLIQSQPDIRLIIIDSIASLFRADDIIHRYYEKAKVLKRIGIELHSLCHKYNLTIISVNQIQAQFDDNIPQACLGLTWSNMIHCRLKISRTNRTYKKQTQTAKYDNSIVYLRNLSIDFSIHLPSENNCDFYIAENGLFGVEIVEKEEKKE